jgi:hypothetical protein
MGPHDADEETRVWRLETRGFVTIQRNSRDQ